MAKRNIDKAKEAKKDEFYTQLDDINNELIQLCKLINIDIEKDYIVNRFDTIIKNY